MGDLNKKFIHHLSNNCNNSNIQPEIQCIQSCTTWKVDYNYKSQDLQHKRNFNVSVITTRNLNESLSNILIKKNNIINNSTFNSLKVAYGKPYIADIQRLNLNLPVDLSKIEICSLNSEFFTFFIEIDLNQEKKLTKNIRKINNYIDSCQLDLLLNVSFLK